MAKLKELLFRKDEEVANKDKLLVAFREEQDKKDKEMSQKDEEIAALKDQLDKEKKERKEEETNLKTTILKLKEENSTQAKSYQEEKQALTNTHSKEVDKLKKIIEELKNEAILEKEKSN